MQLKGHTPLQRLIRLEDTVRSLSEELGNIQNSIAGNTQARFKPGTPELEFECIQAPSTHTLRKLMTVSAKLVEVIAELRTQGEVCKRLQEKGCKINSPDLP